MKHCEDSSMEHGQMSFYCALFILCIGAVLLHIPKPSLDLYTVVGSFFLWLLGWNIDFGEKCPYESYCIKCRMNTTMQYRISLGVLSLGYAIMVWFIVPDTYYGEYYRPLHHAFAHCIRLSVIAVACGVFASRCFVFNQFCKSTKYSYKDSTYILTHSILGNEIVVYNEKDFFDCIKYHSSDSNYCYTLKNLMGKFEQYREQGLDPYMEHYRWLKTTGDYCFFKRSARWEALRLTMQEYEIYKDMRTEALLILMFCDIGDGEIRVSIKSETQKLKSSHRKITTKSIRMQTLADLKEAIRRRTRKFPETGVKIKQS